MSRLLPCVEVGPSASEVATASVVWLHGLGASGHDFEPVVPYLHLPTVRFVFPHAPSRPVTINGGMVMPAWYDIRTLGPGGAVEEHIEESRQAVEALLEREVERGSRRLVLAGFSQGAGVALLTGIRTERPLAGIVVLSGYELQTRLAGGPSAANALTPILFCHGTYDPLLPVALGRAAYDSFSGGERRVEWHEYPIGHEVCMPEIELVAAWLREVLEL